MNNTQLLVQDEWILLPDKLIQLTCLGGQVEILEKYLIFSDLSLILNVSHLANISLACWFSSKQVNLGLLFQMASWGIS